MKEERKICKKIYYDALRCCAKNYLTKPLPRKQASFDSILAFQFPPTSLQFTRTEDGERKHTNIPSLFCCETDRTI